MSGSSSGLQTRSAGVGSWRFASDLAPERVEEFIGMITASGLGLEQVPDNVSQQDAQPEEMSEADAAFARMVAANPSATVIDRIPPSEADLAFERMVAANPTAAIIDRPSAAQPSEADLAFARMVASNPTAVVIDGCGAAHADTLARIQMATNPNGMVILGPAGGGKLPTPTEGTSGGSNGWTFSKDLSPEARSEIQGMLALNGLG